MSGRPFRAKVIEAGRVTIPLEIRETEDISEGDYVDITVKLVKKAQEVPA